MAGQTAAAQRFPGEHPAGFRDRSRPPSRGDAGAAGPSFPRGRGAPVPRSPSGARAAAPVSFPPGFGPSPLPRLVRAPGIASPTGVEPGCSHGSVNNCLKKTITIIPDRLQQVIGRFRRPEWSRRSTRSTGPCGRPPTSRMTVSIPSQSGRPGRSRRGRPADLSRCRSIPFPVRDGAPPLAVRIADTTTATACSTLRDRRPRGRPDHLRSRPAGRRRVTGIGRRRSADAPVPRGLFPLPAYRLRS